MREIYRNKEDDKYEDLCDSENDIFVKKLEIEMYYLNKQTNQRIKCNFIWKKTENIYTYIIFDLLSRSFFFESLSIFPKVLSIFTNEHRKEAKST